MGKVSVIIPAFNGVSRYLEQAIRSVLEQTCRDFELIVVDDASTDDTARLVFRFPQARYFKRAENGGQAAARNDGVRLAQGEYLAFLDQDDLWEPSLLDEMVTRLQGVPEAAAVHCDGYQVNEQNEVLEYDGAMKQIASITQILRGGHDMATSGSLFRRACFNAVGGYDQQLAIWEDIDLAIRLYERYRIIHLGKPLYRHRLYALNASQDIPSERALSGRRRFLERHGPSCKPGTTGAKALSRDWSRYYADLGKYLLKEGGKKEARHAFWASVRHWPLNHKAMLRLLRSYVIHSKPRLPKT